MFVGDIMDRNHDLKTIISKCLYFKQAWSNQIDIIKIATMFIKTTFKNSKKVKRIRNYVLNWNLYLYFLNYQNLLFPIGKNADVSRIHGVCHVIYIFIQSSLGNVPREGVFSFITIYEQPEKGRSCLVLKLRT